ncbi:hypothetical protein DRO31_03195 [Candidatus Bathyarchaeota archaeon]|nr:MAG: hypothetical protein DRO31_03195 [Candidatus Bathyarchaeota archaeon]
MERLLFGFNNLPKEVMEKLPDALIVVKDRRIIYANPAVSKLLGYGEATELIGADALEIIHPGLREKVRALARGLDESTGLYEVNLVRFDGELVDVEVIIRAAVIEESRVYIIVARDIKERIRSRKRLNALHKHVDKLSNAENIEEIIEITKDAMKTTLDFEFSSILVADDNELVLHTFDEQHDGIRLPLDGPGLTVKAAKTKKTIMVDDTRKSPDYLLGSVSSLSELDVPVVVDGKTVMVLNVEHNFVNAFNKDHKLMLEILASHIQMACNRLNYVRKIELMAEQQIKESIKSFQEIHNQVRHDIRSPLQAINNAVHILSTDPDNQKMRTILGAQINYVKTILEDWETQSINGELKKEEANISELIQTAIKTKVGDKAETSLYIDETLVWSIDYNRLLRAISNILQNSVEAMPEGGAITIDCHLKGENLMIIICDTGVGIPEESLLQIGQPFYTTKQKGMGLGLSFVRQVVESHEGTIKITSKTGKGTTITIKLPK